ncbi:MAG: acetate--CoA ligase family protein [Candidatus Cloacimonetes bacterium]|nr:acetate--CoA ligase family protein [Candidatus Cloacimonadota bacterium]
MTEINEGKNDVKEIIREDFEIRSIYVYSGPNYYLNKKAVVFNLYLKPDGLRIDHYAPRVLKNIAVLSDRIPEAVVDLFAEVLIYILKMDIDLFINDYSIQIDGDEYTIAVEYLDEFIAEECIFFVRDWFRAMSKDAEFDFIDSFHLLQANHDKTLFGGPTLYSLVEAGLKRKIPVNYFAEENQFQWGYGKKQIRGRSTTFHVDGIKDTEFTMYKDMVAEFLEMFGFPTPQGKNCYTEEEIIEQAELIGYPVVVKPVAGHKGQGVTTGIETAEEVRKAFSNILKSVEKEKTQFDGVIVQKMIYGFDHRLLSVGGKFVAALERVPAYVEGNGKNSIKELIEIENATVNRIDNPRSPLCKIVINEDMHDYLAIQDLNIEYVPKQDERIYLRRVANISQGGVSINVTNKIHPKNIKLVEDIAKYFNVTCLGIDVLAKDISKPWDEGNFGIIEVNAGPGVFMHLAPAQGGSIDVPGIIMKNHFPKDGYERIPIIIGNKLSLNFSHILYDKLRELKPDIFYEGLTQEGVYTNREYFFKGNTHDKRVKIILRNPKLDFALFNHTKDDIFDYGIYHEGADIVVLEAPHYAEESLKRELLPSGYYVEVLEDSVSVYQYDKLVGTLSYDNPVAKDYIILKAIEPLLPCLLTKYELDVHPGSIWNYAKF